VNFVDPTGLKEVLAVPCPPGWQCITINSSAPRWDGFTAFWLYIFFGQRGGIGGPGDPGRGGGGGDPQNPGRDEKEISDCQQFAANVDVIANNSSSRREFLDTLARTFTSANNSSIQEMRHNAGGPLVLPRLSFGSSGFKPQFIGPANQVRHFVGGFIAGADVGWLPARTFLNSLEQPGRDDEDIALNGVSTRLGANTIGNGIGYIRRNTANDIRSEVCQ
jgi:hypothetical protein